MLRPACRKGLFGYNVEAGQKKTHSGGRKNDKGLNQDNVCRDGMLGIDSRAIKEVELAGRSN